MGARFRGWPRCDICREPVTKARGVLSISVHAAGERAKGVARWKEEQSAGERFQTMTAAQLMTMPSAVAWCWSHDSCAPAENDYEIEADRFDTVSKVLDWTLHLAGKRWLEPEAWAETVGRFYDVPNA